MRFQIDTSPQRIPALYLAVRRGRLPVVKALLDKKVDVTATCRVNGVWMDNAESYARRLRHADIAEAIRDARATATSDAPAASDSGEPTASDSGEPSGTRNHRPNKEAMVFLGRVH